MTTNKKVWLGLAVAYLLLWTIYNYSTATSEDFAQQGAGVVLTGAIAGAFGGLLATLVVIVLPIALLFWVFSKPTKKKPAEHPPTKPE